MWVDREREGERERTRKAGRVQIKVCVFVRMGMPCYPFVRRKGVCLFDMICRHWPWPGHDSLSNYLDEVIHDSGCRLAPAVSLTSTETSIRYRRRNLCDWGGGGIKLAGETQEHATAAKRRMNIPCPRATLHIKTSMGRMPSRGTFPLPVVWYRPMACLSSSSETAPG
jgi:hypothetical protein